MMMSWLSKRQISPYLAIAIFFMLVFGWLCQVTPQRVGDGGEYYALFFAWAETLRPWMTQESFNGYETFFLKSSVAGLNPRESLESAFPALHLGATSDFNHFWFYSFLAFLSSKLIFGFDLQHEPHKSYLLLHFMLLLITASISYRLFKMRGLAAFLIMTLTSPIVWYFDKVHTELFTYCMVLISIMLMRQDRFIPAAAALSMAATQNPSFAIIALFPFSYRFLGLRGLRFSATETLLTVGVALMVLMHPVYYFLRYGVPTPQLLAGGAELGRDLSSFYIWLIDPDVGLLPHWPAGVLLLFSFAYFITKKRPPLQSLLSNKTIWFYLIFFLVNFYAHASTTNMNSGASPGLARYSLWYLPAFFPVIMMVLEKLKKGVAVYFGLVMVAFALLNTAINNPTHPEDYITPSRLSLFIQKHLAGFYDPPPEVFAERYSGFGEQIQGLNPRAVVGPDCKKVLVYPGIEPKFIATPKDCFLSNALISKKVDDLDLSINPTPFYARLPDKIVKESVLSIEPNDIFFGLGDAGNQFLRSGWTQPEAGGVWSIGSPADLSLPCNASQYFFGKSKVVILIDLSPFGHQTLKVEHSGTAIFEGLLKRPERIRMTVAVGDCKSGSIDLVFKISNPVSPSDLGQSNDHRKLGIGLRKLRILTSE